MNEIAEFLKECGTFYVATNEGNQPRVRPFGALDVYEGKLYIVTSNQKKVFAQLKDNPKIEICALNPNRMWIRIAATAVVDDRRDARAHMLEANPNLKRLYSVDDGIMEVAYLTNGEAAFTSYGEPPRIVRF